MNLFSINDADRLELIKRGWSQVESFGRTCWRSPGGAFHSDSEALECLLSQKIHDRYNQAARPICLTTTNE